MTANNPGNAAKKQKISLEETAHDSANKQKISAGTTKDIPAAKASISQFPLIDRLLLVGSYLASYVSPKNDQRLFSSTNVGKKRAQNDDKVNKFFFFL